ncbi:MAG: phage portal protein, partial [Actinobacteria bacterium]|nr:phage portal protein [Actinomycetota bacterium]NIU71569.1 phage portal protein [Actinomycetota bacterium]NIW33519.1 phage portal protein [Actinomycetota bacterium]NIX25630.1 phage portal protein [Actinomycetota bacterium]
FLAGFLYHGPNGEQVPLSLDEVIHIRYPNPLDPYRGLGPVQSAMIDLDSARYSAEWNRNFFVNSAEPGGHLET